ncbi:uracil-DNA glycosylase [Candidatus Woesearchaeota archaeon]|nr:uracil-DNA glycosylase [Candidatus Woesearchaeota archaeon]
MACKWINICPLRRFEQQGKLDLRWKKEYCESENNWKNCRRYELEEKSIPHGNLLPDGTQIDGKDKND